jgi:DNA invertase Pin-like site-specific DNA recombinase
MTVPADFIEVVAPHLNAPSLDAIVQFAKLAEVEREITRERIFAGLVRAKAQDKTLGRKPASSKTEKRIRELCEKGLGKLKIGRTLGCGVSTVQRVLAEAA